MAKIEELTFFRFIAAAIVVVFHFGRDAAGLEGFWAAGPQMVAFFFVLSGFVMGVSCLNREIDKVSYWWARIARIMPVYLLALALMIYMEDAWPDGTPLFLSLFLLQAWISPYPLAINSPGWSLSVEAFFYLLFPFVAQLIRGRGISAKGMMVVALSCWGVTQVLLTSVMTTGLYGGFPSLSHDLIYYFPPVHFGSFALGLAGAMWWMDRKSRGGGESASLLPAGLAGLLVFFSIHYQDKIAEYAGLKIEFCSSFFSPVFLVFIIAIASCRSGAVRLLRAGPLVLLGEASYSLYILQAPLFKVFDEYIARSLKLPPLPNFLLFSLLLVVLSVFCFLVFEKPINKLMKGLLAPAGVRTAVGASPLRVAPSPCRTDNSSMPNN